MLEIKLQGDNRTIGRQHGAALRSEIRKTLSIYFNQWRIPEAEISSRVAGFKKATETYFPHLREEIRGIAEGASLDESLIYAINARTELLTGMDLRECTAVGIQSGITKEGDVILAQNWDWINSLRGLTRVVQINPANKPKIKMLIEPGMIGKMGINEYLGVCLNFLHTYQRNERGLPVHILMRAILEQTSHEDAIALVSSLPRAASANYVIGAPNNSICNLETTPTEVNRTLCEGFITHTNSYIELGERCARQKKFETALRRYIERSGKISAEDLKNAFKLEGVRAIETWPGGIETVHTIIMNLTKKRMLVSEGLRSDEFSVYHLN